MKTLAEQMRELADNTNQYAAVQVADALLKIKDQAMKGKYSLSFHCTIGFASYIKDQLQEVGFKVKCECNYYLEISW